MLPAKAMTYRRARLLLLAAGLAVLALVVVSMVLRGVDPTEVTATLLFAPIFAAAVSFGLWAGLGLAVAAAATYLTLRWPAIELVGFPALSGLVFSRLIGYVAFGGIGGWASQTLNATLDRFHLHDEVDDATGLRNGRSFLVTLDRERARSERYSSVFSVVIARFEPGLTGRRLAQALRGFGELLGSGVRASDHVSHLAVGNVHVVSVILPDTASEGAATVDANLASALERAMRVAPTHEHLTIPGDEERLTAIEAEYRRWDASLRPPEDR